MKDDMDFKIKKTLQHAMIAKEMSSSFEKIWSLVKINDKSNATWFRTPVFMIFALLIFAAPVSAAVIYTWKSIQISQTQKTTPLPTVSWMPLNSYTDMLKSEYTFSLQESEKKAGIKFLRPMGNKLPLELSVGEAERSGASVIFWDIYHDGNDWIVANQSTSTNVAKSIQDKLELKVELNKNQGIIPLSDGERVAYYEDLGNQEYRVVMLVKKGEKVVHLDVRGNVPKEELISLVSSYH
jgi:hypothetical protein